VGPPAALAELRPFADEVVSLELHWDFYGIGQFYADFGQTSDEEVIACLQRVTGEPPASVVVGPDPHPRVDDADVVIADGAALLRGRLAVPDRAPGVVVFAHGSGSSRHSPRNRLVAAILQRAGIGTLLFDLLTPGEEADRSNVFDIDLLTRRLLLATGWLREQPGLDDAPLGYFGASTGAAAALQAAAGPGPDIAAVVCRSGRADLAGARLAAVRAPTLLIVGGDDHRVLELNRTAFAALRCEKRLVVIPGASHLFDEPGTLMAAAGAARAWFAGHLIPAAAVPPLTRRR